MEQEIINEKIELLKSVCKEIIIPTFTYNVRKSDFSDDTFYVEFTHENITSRYRISEHFDKANRISLITRVQKSGKKTIKQYLKTCFNRFKYHCIMDKIKNLGEKNES